jgi:hypothetical protein
MVGADQGESAQEPGHNHEKEIERICTVLGFAASDEIHQLWWDFASPLHRYTHRSSLGAVRAVDDDFLEWWALAQAVIHRITSQFEIVYGELLPSIRVLAQKEAPTGKDLTQLRETVPHSYIAMKTFYGTATPEWFKLLREKKYFVSPPPLEPDEEGRVSYLPWAPSEYLVRLAATKQFHADVIDVALGLDGTDNPAAQEAVIDIALVVPASEGAELAEQVAAYLATPFQWRLPYKARDLIIHFANEGQTAASLAILRALLVSRVPGSGEWRQSALLKTIVAALFPRVGLAGLELLADLLDEELDRDSSKRRHDLSYIWRPHLAGSIRQTPLDSLISALNEAAGIVAAADPSQIEAIVALLEGRDTSIFTRIALDLLRRVPNDELIAERLSDHERFENFNLEREWTQLAQGHFAFLAEEVQKRILGWIEAGPTEDGEEGEDAEERRERWQRAQLMRLGEELPDDWRERRDQLIERYGAPSTPIRDRIVRPVPAVFSKDELAAKSVEELLEYLDSWVPGEWFDGTSANDLGNVLAEVVADDPCRFAVSAASFSETEPTYVRHLLAGLGKAANDGKGFEWQQVLQLASSALEQPRLIEERPEDDRRGLDRGWITTRLEIARLLSTGLRQALIPAELADHVWTILLSLSDDPEPDSVYEEKWDEEGTGPSSLALNTVRGAAVHALFCFMWSRKQLTPTGEEPRLEERIRQVLDRRLDPVIEPTRAIRSVYGQRFPFIVAADRVWASERVKSIFGRASDGAGLGRAAWDSYLFHTNNVYDTTFELLRKHYVAAVERIVAGEADDDQVREQLLGHLVCLYVAGKTELDDDLFGRFISAAPAKECARVIETIGFDLERSTFGEEKLGRLRALWESRFEALSAGGKDALRELRGFGWWLGSGRFEADWSLGQLTRLFEAGGTVDPDHVVIERLKELRDEHLPEVVRALAAMIEATDEPWFVLGSREEIRDILLVGLKSSDSGVNQAARQATNRLVARGHPEFVELL